MTIRYVHRLTRDDVGGRVVVRRWVDDPERGRVPSDVVGVLETWSGDVLAIRTKRDDLVTVDEEDILASRRIS